MMDGIIKRPGFIPFTEKQWNDYKERLMVTIAREGLSCDEVMADPQAAQFVRNYAEANFIDPKKVEERRQLGITFKFAVMNVETNRGTISYSIVNEYKGHHIYRTGYFVREGQEIKMKYIDVVPERKFELLT